MRIHYLLLEHYYNFSQKKIYLQILTNPILRFTLSPKNY